MTSTVRLAFVLLTAALAPCFAAQPYPPRLEGARAESYKRIGGVALDLYIYEPAAETPAKNNRPAIVFFFGGGWSGGSPAQFEQHCRYFASRGLVAITADYRVASRHHVKVGACLADAKSALRWVRQNAGRLGIDPNRIAAGGGSAGGHLAAAAAMVPGFEEPGEAAQVSAAPNALVLFNPPLVLAPLDGVDLREFAAQITAERMGTEPRNLSPAHHVKHGAPPTIVFHGRADTAVPFVTAQAFADAMKKAGNRCELIGFDGQPHGFFNYGRNENIFYDATVEAADRFLASLGWLKGAPTLAKRPPR